MTSRANNILRNIFVALLTSVAALPICDGSSAAAASRLRWHSWPNGAPPLAHGDNGLPPTSVQPQMPVFWSLLASYEAIGIKLPVSFEQWIVMNGITDPGLQAYFMWLYHWYLHRDAFHA